MAHADEYHDVAPAKQHLREVHQVGENRIKDEYDAKPLFTRDIDLLALETACGSSGTKMGMNAVTEVNYFVPPMRLRRASILRSSACAFFLSLGPPSSMSRRTAVSSSSSLPKAWARLSSRVGIGCAASARETASRASCGVIPS